jgi:hypothetical protein
MNVSSAKGSLGSGAIEVWKGHVTADQTTVRQLSHQLPKSVDDYRTLTHAQLEDKLVEVHNVTRTANKIADKYRASLADDDKDRDWLRDAVQRRISSRD